MTRDALLERVRTIIVDRDERVFDDKAAQSAIKLAVEDYCAANFVTQLCHAEKVLCNLGLRIAAIKSLRDRLPLTLLEAKRETDQYIASNQYRDETYRMAPPKF